MPRAVRPFEFAEGDSFLHRLNPVTKLLMIFSVTALVITFLDPLVGLAIAMALYAVALAAKVPRQLIIIYKRVVLLMGGAFATLYFIFYTVGPYLFEGRFSVLGFVWAASCLYRLAKLIRIVASYASTLRLPQFVFTQPLFEKLAASSPLHLLGGFLLIVAFALFNIFRRL